MIDITKHIERLNGIVGKVSTNLNKWDKVINITDDCNFVGIGKNKDGITFLYENYSSTINAMPSEIDYLKNKLPNFSFNHIYLNYYIVGFNKKMRTFEEYLNSKQQ